VSAEGYAADGRYSGSDTEEEEARVGGRYVGRFDKSAGGSYEGGRKGDSYMREGIGRGGSEITDADV
jgi:hypothetical protein